MQGAIDVTGETVTLEEAEAAAEEQPAAGAEGAEGGEGGAPGGEPVEPDPAEETEPQPEP